MKSVIYLLTRVASPPVLQCGNHIGAAACAPEVHIFLKYSVGMPLRGAGVSPVTVFSAASK